MRSVPLQDAFDLSEVYRLKLGARTVDVPPLSLRRFLALCGADFARLAGALVELLPREAPAPADETSLTSLLGKQLALLDPKPFAELIAAACPGVSAAEWRDVGSPVELMCLVAHFARVHDWPLIGRAIGFGQERAATEPATTRDQLGAALVSLARATGYRIEDLLAMRVEGFYALKDAAVELARDPEEQEADPVALGVANRVHDPEKKSPLWAALDAAEGKVQ